MNNADSRRVALDAALAQSERLYREINQRASEDKGVTERFDEECERLARESGHLGRTFYREMTRWKESEYDPDGRKACEEAACVYEASLDRLLVHLTYQNASEALQIRIVTAISLELLLGADLKVLVNDHLLTTGEPPPPKLRYLLIGGRGHGSTADIEDGSKEYESEIFSDEEERASIGHETYRRLYFEGVGFGAGFECYGLAEDDRTETRELARYLLQERKILSQRNEGTAA